MPSLFRPPDPRPWATPEWTLFFLIAFGPLGAGAASCRRWERAALELSLCSSSVILLVAGLRKAQIDGLFSLENGLSPGAWSWPLGVSLAFAAAGFSMWIFDFWLMSHWHGLRADPMLDTDFQE